MPNATAAAVEFPLASVVLAAVLAPASTVLAVALTTSTPSTEALVPLRFTAPFITAEVSTTSIASAADSTEASDLLSIRSVDLVATKPKK